MLPSILALKTPILLLALAGSAIAGDTWPRFRGHNGDGSSDATSIPAEWNEEAFRWKADLPGTGHSSPIIWGERLFITSGDPQTAERIVLCYDALSGEMLWERRFSSTPHKLHNDNSYASNSPAADEKHIYVAFVTPQQYLVLALDHDGNEVWRRELGPFASQHGFGASPVIFGDLVIFTSEQEASDNPTTDSFVIALERESGETRWRVTRPTSRTAYATPSLFYPEDGGPQLILASDASGITALDPASGNLLWKVGDVFPFPWRCVNSPVVAGGLIFASCGEGGVGKKMIGVRAPNSPAEEPRVVYTTSRSAPYVPTPVECNGLLFIWRDAGTVVCLDLETHEELWTGRVGGSFHGSPVCVDGKLYCVSWDGEVAVVAADRTFQILAKNDLGEPSRSTPAVAHGRMYVRTESTLFCIGK
jgi:outer membrane protein assembly factor BamB